MQQPKALQLSLSPLNSISRGEPTLHVGMFRFHVCICMYACIYIYICVCVCVRVENMLQIVHDIVLTMRFNVLITAEGEALDHVCVCVCVYVCVSINTPVALC